MPQKVTLKVEVDLAKIEDFVLGLAKTLNQKVDVPFVPESVEAKAFEQGANAAFGLIVAELPGLPTRLTALAPVKALSEALGDAVNVTVETK